MLLCRGQAGAGSAKRVWHSYAHVILYYFIYVVPTVLPVGTRSFGYIFFFRVDLRNIQRYFIHRLKEMTSPMQSALGKLLGLCIFVCNLCL